MLNKLREMFLTKETKLFFFFLGLLLQVDVWFAII